MIGAARTTGAISITNALPAGLGCAIGIDLPVEARVRLTRGGTAPEPTIEILEEARTPLVEAALRDAISAYFPETHAVATLVLRSDIPPARGLKSSSAVSTAILLATARAAGRDPDALEIARRSAAVGVRCGVSATGALDDALAGLVPGFVLADNLRGEVLRRWNVEPELGVALYVPSLPHPPSPDMRAAFAGERPRGELAARAAYEGDWARAMQLNSEIVERTMGYRYEGLRRRLEAKGAVASGVSGLGPALAVIAPTASLAVLVHEFPADDAWRSVVSFARSMTGEARSA